MALRQKAKQPCLFQCYFLFGTNWLPVPDKTIMVNPRGSLVSALFHSWSNEGWTNYSLLMINENNNSDQAATQQAKGWLEAQFLMSIQDNMCCRCHATVDKETHHFNSHADHKQDPLMRDRASSTLKKNSIRFCTKTQLYSAQQIIKSREFSYYLAGVGSRNEQFQSLSFQLCEPSIAVLTPDHSFTARRAPAAWGRRSSPKTRGAAQRAGRFSPNSWRDGPRRSREGPRWGDPWAWGRGARGARHGAGSLWGRTCARAGGFIISFSVPCVWKERRRFGWGSIRHLGKKGRMKRTWHWKRIRSRIKLLLMPIEIKYNNLAVHIDSFWVPVLCFIELNLHHVKTTPPISGKTTGCAWPEKRWKKTHVLNYVHLKPSYFLPPSQIR